MRPVLLGLLAAGLLGACAEGQHESAGAPPVAIGVPVTAKQLWAANPRGGRALVLSRVRRPGMDRRDICFRFALEGQPPAEADERCLARDPRGGVVELRLWKGGPDAPVSIVAGHAGSSVRKLVLEVDGGSHEVWISSWRGFLAVLPGSYEGRVALLAREADGTVATRSFVQRP